MDIFKSSNDLVQKVHNTFVVNPAVRAGWLKIEGRDTRSGVLDKIDANTKIVMVSWISGAVRVGVNSVMAVANLVIAVVSPLFLQFATSRNAFSRLGGNIKQIGHGTMLSIPVINVIYMRCVGLYPQRESNLETVPVSSSGDTPAEPKSEMDQVTDLISGLVETAQNGDALAFPTNFSTNMGWPFDNTPPEEWMNLPAQSEKIDVDIGVDDVHLSIDRQTYIDLSRKKVQVSDTLIKESEDGPVLIYNAISEVVPQGTPNREKIIEVALVCCNQAFVANAINCIEKLADKNIFMGQIAASPLNLVTYKWENNQLVGAIGWSFGIGHMDDPETPLFHVCITRHFHVDSEGKAISDGETYDFSLPPSRTVQQ